MVDEVEWRPVPGYPSYDVSSDGRVRSWRRKTRNWRAPQDGRRDEPIPMTGTVGHHGYIFYVLRNAEGERRNMVGHRLVALAFLPAPLPDQTDVAHNDGCTSNNGVENLRWATHKANQMDMRRHGTMQDGERCITAKITAEVAATIRRRAAEGPRGIQIQLAREYGLSKAQVCRIAKGRRWQGL